MDLIDIIRTFHPNAEEYTFSSAHGTVSRIECMLGNITSLNKFKIAEIMLRVFSKNNSMRQEVK